MDDVKGPPTRASRPPTIQSSSAPRLPPQSSRIRKQPPGPYHASLPKRPRYNSSSTFPQPERNHHSSSNAFPQRGRGGGGWRGSERSRHMSQQYSAKPPATGSNTIPFTPRIPPPSRSQPQGAPHQMPRHNTTPDRGRGHSVRGPPVSEIAASQPTRSSSQARPQPATKVEWSAQSMSRDDILTQSAATSIPGLRPSAASTNPHRRKQVQAPPRRTSSPTRNQQDTHTQGRNSAHSHSAAPSATSSLPPILDPRPHPQIQSVATGENSVNQSALRNDGIGGSVSSSPAPTFEFSEASFFGSLKDIEPWLANYFSRFENNRGSLAELYTTDTIFSLGLSGGSLPSWTRAIHPLSIRSHHGRENVIRALQALPPISVPGNRRLAKASAVPIEHTSHVLLQVHGNFCVLGGSVADTVGFDRVLTLLRQPETSKFTIVSDILTFRKPSPPDPRRQAEGPPTPQRIPLQRDVISELAPNAGGTSERALEDMKKVIERLEQRMEKWEQHNAQGVDYGSPGPAPVLSSNGRSFSRLSSSGRRAFRWFWLGIEEEQLTDNLLAIDVGGGLHGLNNTSRTFEEYIPPIASKSVDSACCLGNVIVAGLYTSNPTQPSPDNNPQVAIYLPNQRARQFLRSTPHSFGGVRAVCGLGQTRSSSHRFATGGKGHKSAEVYLWNVDHEMRADLDQLTLPTSSIVGLEYSDSHNCLSVAGLDKRFQLVDVFKGTVLHNSLQTAPISSVMNQPATSSVLLSLKTGGSEQFRLIDLRTYQEVKRWGFPSNHNLASFAKGSFHPSSPHFFYPDPISQAIQIFDLRGTPIPVGTHFSENKAHQLRFKTDHLIYAMGQMNLGELNLS